MARKLSRITKEAEEREKRLRGDLEQLRSRQEQILKLSIRDSYDAEKTHSGYHGQIGQSPGKQERI